MDFENLGRVSRGLPQPTVDDGDKELRLDRYGSQIINVGAGGKQNLADEGAYYVATNPTPGTAVVFATVTAFADTTALFVFKNDDKAGTKAKRIYFDYIRLLLKGTAPTTAASWEYAIKTDADVSRAPTAGSTAIIPVNPNADEASASIAKVFAFSAAALTVPASSGAARLVSRGTLEQGLNVTGDEYVLAFGPADTVAGGNALTAARAAQPARFVNSAPPVILGPQQWMVFYVWFPVGGSAASLEYELAWWER